MNSNRLKIAFSCAVTVASIAILVFTHGDDTSADVVGNVPGSRDCEVKCQDCGEKYRIPLATYLSESEGRSDKTKGLICRACGLATAWLGEPPIEYTDRKWKAGWVGRDVLKENLKAYHAANPEPSGEGVGVEF